MSLVFPGTKPFTADQAYTTYVNCETFKEYLDLFFIDNDSFRVEEVLNCKEGKYKNLRQIIKDVPVPYLAFRDLWIQSGTFQDFTEDEHEVNAAYTFDLDGFPENNATHKRGFVTNKHMLVNVLRTYVFKESL